MAARIARPFGSAAARPRHTGRRSSRRPEPSSRWRPIAAATAAFAAVWGLIASVLQRRGVRRVLLALIICLPLLAGGYLLIRRSPLSTVEHVRVSGVQGSQSGAIEAALVTAARHMSTLGVNDAALREAVSSYPVVAAVSAHPSFPHSLSIVVTEQPPVASVNVGGADTAVAADGAVLGSGKRSSSLPSVGGEYLSSAAV